MVRDAAGFKKRGQLTGLAGSRIGGEKHARNLTFAYRAAHGIRPRDDRPGPRSQSEKLQQATDRKLRRHALVPGAGRFRHSLDGFGAVLRRYAAVRGSRIVFVLDRQLVNQRKNLIRFLWPDGRNAEQIVAIQVDGSPVEVLQAAGCNH